MQSSLVNFIQVLRSRDVRVSPAETLDAMDVAALLGYADPQRLKHGLGMALAKTPEEEAVFSDCFDRFFSQRLSDFSDDDGEAADEAASDEGAGEQVDDGDNGTEEPSGTTGEAALQAAAADNPQLQSLLETPLMQGLVNNDRNELSVALSRAAEQVGLRQIQLFTQKGQFTRRMLDELGEEHIRGAVVELERNGSPALPVLQRYRDILREQVRDRVEREYLLHAEGRNRQFMDEVLAKTRLNNIEQVYMERVRELVHKMARKLAGRHARRRRNYRRGQLHTPRTIRRGVATDGVMFNTYWRRIRKDKPQILAICDVSGSVAAYAKFLLLFLYSLQDVLPRVRSFAFSSHLGEVSSLFDEYPVEQAIEMVNRKYGGAADYGNSLINFTNLALDDVTGATTVIILGDARNNHGDARLDILQSIYQRARQVIWLNPESRRAWGTGDSEMLRYQSACHFTAECNNLKQLERIIDQLLKSTR